MNISIMQTGKPYEQIVKLDGLALGWVVPQRVNGTSWKAVNQDNEIVAWGCKNKVSAACALVENVLTEEKLQQGAMG